MPWPKVWTVIEVVEVIKVINTPKLYLFICAYSKNSLVLVVHTDFE